MKKIQVITFLPGRGLHPNYLNESLLSNIFNATCTKSPLIDKESSTDSTIVPSESSGVIEHDSASEQQALLTIHRLFSATEDNQPEDQVLVRRSRSQKADDGKKTCQRAQAQGSSFDWLQDEDMLFGKIVALRLRSLATDQRRQMKIVIEQLFERQERGLSIQLFND